MLSDKVLRPTPQQKPENMLVIRGIMWVCNEKD